MKEKRKSPRGRELATRRDTTRHDATRRDHRLQKSGEINKDVGKELRAAQLLRTYAYGTVRKGFHFNLKAIGRKERKEKKSQLVSPRILYCVL